MLWICLAVLALPVSAEVSLSPATEAPQPSAEAPIVSTVPTAVNISSITESTPESVPVTFHFKDGTKLEGRWRAGSLVLDLPQGPLHTSADLLQKIEFVTGTLDVPVAAPQPPPEPPQASAAAAASPPPKPLAEPLVARAYKAGGVFGGAARRPSQVLGWDAGFSFRPASERWEGRLEGGMFTHERRSSIYSANDSETHTQWANIKFLRASCGRLIGLGEFGYLRSLIGIIPASLRLGGGIGLYRLNSREHHAYLFNYNTISTYEPQRSWHEVVPHFDAGIIIRLHRRVELQVSAEFIASKTHVAGYRYGGFSELLQIAIR